MEYELVHIKAWNRKIAEVQKSLESTLLVKDPHNEIILVNFDPHINELMREIDVMTQMNIDVPMKAREMRMRREELKTKYNNVKVSHPAYHNLGTCKLMIMFFSL